MEQSVVYKAHKEELEALKLKALVQLHDKVEARKKELKDELEALEKRAEQDREHISKAPTIEMLNTKARQLFINPSAGIITV